MFFKMSFYIKYNYVAFTIVSANVIKWEALDNRSSISSSTWLDWVYLVSTAVDQLPEWEAETLNAQLFKKTHSRDVLIFNVIM